MPLSLTCVSLPSQPCPGPPVLFVFSKQHRPYDCAIDLLPSAPLPSPSVLPMHHQSSSSSLLTFYKTRLVFVYLDDILIYSPSLQQHKEHVRRVLQRLLEKCLFLKISCHVLNFLGYVISLGRMEMVPDKVLC